MTRCAMGENNRSNVLIERGGSIGGVVCAYGERKNPHDTPNSRNGLQQMGSRCHFTGECNRASFRARVTLGSLRICSSLNKPMRAKSDLLESGVEIPLRVHPTMFDGFVATADLLASQAKTSRTTRPWTSVSRKSRPACLNVSCSWSNPMRASRVAWRSWTCIFWSTQ
jgi:hypothetical protein